MKKPVKKLSVPTLEDRLAALHEEIDDAIARFVDERAAICPGLPRGIIEQVATARARGCKCEAFRIVNGKK
jgi:hypothetical protein